MGFAIANETWDTDPFAYQTLAKLMPAGGLHGQLLTYVTEVVRIPLKKPGLMLLVDTFLLYRNSSNVKKRIGPDLGTLHIPIKVVNICFGNGASLLSRNPHLAFVSGNPLRSIPETTVKKTYWARFVIDGGLLSSTIRL